MTLRTLFHAVLGLLMLGLAGLPGFAHAEVTFEQLRQLPPLPAAYSDEPDAQARMAWLRQQLAGQPTPAERMRLERILAMEHLEVHQTAEAAALCQARPPLREDIRYREACLTATLPQDEALVPQLLALADDARALNRPSQAAQVLSNLAWRLSQSGDITAAFQQFEAALAAAPSDDPELLSGLMMDTATSYIVNGDDSYIRKGIALLEQVKAQLQRELAQVGARKNPDQGAHPDDLRNNIALTEFNRGIAHLLHLHDPAQALPHFDRVAAEPSLYQADALVFAAVAAAEQRLTARAQDYLRRLERAEREAASASTTRSASPTVQQYLSCYRQLAARHWNPAQGLAACLQLKPDTAAEVQLDVYKRLSNSNDPAIALAGLKRLKELFLTKLEPQLRRRGSSAASNVELKRLQRESELKSMVLQQQQQLQQERDATIAQRQRYFIAVTLLLLTGGLLIASQWRAKKKLAEQFERLSVVDTLTQLGNRRHLEQHIARELLHLQRQRRTQPQATLGIYLFDVDRFKSINDRYGHGVGDEVLVTLSQRVQAATRKTDLLVRWGGEEFMLVTRLDEPARCQQVAERLLHAVNAEPFAISGHPPLPVTCTIGAVRSPFAGEDPARSWSSLVTLADQALYLGKDSGRNRWVIVSAADLDAEADLDALVHEGLPQAQDAGRVTVAMG